MSFTFVDRRGTGRGKSLNNRQKLLRRIKESIRALRPVDIDADGIKKANHGGATNQTNPVKVAQNALHEPEYRYDPSTGDYDVVLVGNDTWERGDHFPLDQPDASTGGSDAGKPGRANETEDDFVVNISRSEFYDVYFEDCELPDLKETSEKVLPEAVLKPAGFQKDGAAPQLSITRSYRNSIGRRLALTVDSREELEELEHQLKLIDEKIAKEQAHDLLIEERACILARVNELRAKIASVPLFERVDLRYRKTEKVQVKSADAVLVMLMDVSGSMDEEKKRAARRFFTLQYAFIERKHPNTDIIFIAHTDEPLEVTEEEFFTSRRSGGTIVSTSLALANKLISERYNPDQTNIYLSYAGDGDNGDDDNALVKAELEEKGLLAKLRHAVYVQVGRTFVLYGSYGLSQLWSTMVDVAQRSRKLDVVKLVDDDDVFTVFHQIYGKSRKSPV